MSLEIVKFRSQKYGELAKLPSHCEGKFAVGLGILGYVGKKEFCFNFFVQITAVSYTHLRANETDSYLV